MLYCLIFTLVNPNRCSKKIEMKISEKSYIVTTNNCIIYMKKKKSILN